MRFILYMTLLFSLKVNGAEDTQFKRNSIWINLNRVEPFDFGTFLLTRFNGVRLVLNCSNNTFYKNKKSHIKYTNIYGIHVKDFLFKKDDHCHIFKQFLLSVFPAVSEKKPIMILLDKNSGFIEKILLPDLDELESGHNKYVEDELASI